MRLALIAYFDIGFSIGIDDGPFSGEAAAALVPAAGMRLALPGQAGSGGLLLDDPDYGMEMSLGRGLRLGLDGSPVVDGWRKAARAVAATEGWARDFSLPPDARAAVLALHDVPFRAAAWADLRSCGVGVVELELSGLPDGLPAEHAVRFLQSFEYAAYGSYGIQPDFASGLRAEARRLLAACAHDPVLHEVTDRRRLGGDGVFPSFLLCLTADSAADFEALRAWRETQGDSFSDLTLDGGRLAASWYVVLSQPRRGQDAAEDDALARHVTRLGGVYCLFFGLCDVLQRLLSTKIARFMDGTTPRRGPGSLDAASVIKLRTMSQLVTSCTDIRTLTQNQEIARFLLMFDEDGRLGDRHARIMSSVDILISVQAQVEEAESEAKDTRVNKFITIITSLTFVSVVADFLNIDTIASGAIPPLAWRALLYGGVLLAFALAFRIMFRK